jgi:hypothetical protein
LGQDWLEGVGFGIQGRPPTVIPPYSEQIVKCKTEEKGVRFIERQLLQPGLIAVSSLVECKDNEFPCLIVNLTNKHINVITHPKLEKPPTAIQGQNPGDQLSIASIKGIRLLREKLRLDQMIEGAKEVKQICDEYAHF